MRRAFLLFLLVLPLSACGGTAITSLDPLTTAAEKTATAAGAHFTFDAHITALGENIAVSGTGEIADQGRKLHMRATVPLVSAPMEVVVADGSVYVRGGPVDSFASGKWVRVKADDRSFNLGQSDPTKLLEYLRATSNVEKRGTATIRGVETTHYVAQIKPDKKLGLKQQVPLDVWVDGEGFVRRMRIDVPQVKATLDLFDFGDVSVAVPAASETTDLSTMLGGG